MSNLTYSPESMEVLPVTSVAHVRNRTLGGLGMLCNMTAVLMLCQSPRIRPPLKVTLISMSLTDFLKMTTAAVWSPQLPCWPGLYVFTSASIISSFMTTFLASHNCLAVYFPTRYKQILDFRRSVIIVVLSWLVGFLSLLGFLGTHIPLGTACYVVAIMHRPGLVVVCCMFILCYGLTIIMSIVVLKRIRRRPKPKTITECGPKTSQKPSQVVSEKRKQSLVDERSDKKEKKRGLSTLVPCSTDSFFQLRNVQLLETPARSSNKTKRSVSWQGTHFENTSKQLYPFSTSNSYQNVHQLAYQPDKSGKMDKSKQVEEETNMCKARCDLLDKDVHNTQLKFASASSLVRKKDMNPLKRLSVPHLGKYEDRYTCRENQRILPKRTTLSLQNFNNPAPILKSERPIKAKDFIEVHIPNPVKTPLIHWRHSTKSHKYVQNNTTIPSHLETDSGLIKSKVQRAEPMNPPTKSVLRTFNDIRHKETVRKRALSLSLGFSSEQILANTTQSILRDNSSSHTKLSRRYSNLEGSQSVGTKQHDWSTLSDVGDIQNSKTNNVNARLLPKITSKSCTGIETLKRLSKRQNYRLNRARSLFYDDRRTRDIDASDKRSDQNDSLLLEFDFENTIKTPKTTKDSGPVQTKCLPTPAVCKSSSLLKTCRVAEEETSSSVSSTNSCGFAVVSVEQTSAQPMATQGCDSLSHSLEAKTSTASHHRGEHIAINDSEINRISSKSSSGCDAHEEMAQHNTQQKKTNHPVTSSNRSRSSGSVTRSATTQTKTKRASWRRRTQYTLLILCSWCCFLSLPFIVYGGYVAFWVEDRASFQGSGFGLVMAGLTHLNSITNPILYCCRFVEWRAIWKTWRTKLTRSITFYRY